MLAAVLVRGPESLSGVARKCGSCIVQAVARDIFVSCLLKLDDEKIWTAMHSHDESVNEVALDKPVSEVEKCMTTAPALACSSSWSLIW